METRTIVNTIWIDMLCESDFCDGKMRPTGRVLESYPTEYRHECTICDIEKNFRKQFPYIEYKEMKP